MKKRTLSLLTLLIGASLLFGACGSKQEPEVYTPAETETAAAEDTETEIIEIVTETETEPVSEIIEEASEEESIPGMLRSPYTGRWIEEETALRRPICVMIENTKPALPQYGLSKADIIYEFPVEGGISRIMGVFQDYSGMERFGNCRSARPYYVLTALEYDAIYVHAGGSTEAYELLHQDIIDEIDGVKGDSNYFYRSSDKSSPHNLYTSSEKLASKIEAAGFSTEITDRQQQHFTFAKDDQVISLEEGEACGAVRVAQDSAKPYFIYNEEEGLYYRFEFGAPQKDGITGEQLAVKNIIIQECSVSIYNAQKGTLNIDLLSSGKGMYITMGRCIDITWSKDSRSGITSYCDSEGNPITLNQGVTWIDVTKDSNSANNIIYSTPEDFK